MVELKSLEPSAVEGGRSKHSVVVCDEAAITCAKLGDLAALIASAGSDVVLMMLDSQYQKGLRGWAKAQILAAVTQNIEGIFTATSQDLVLEIAKDWRQVLIPAPVVLDSAQVLKDNQKVFLPRFLETTAEEDRRWIRRAEELVNQSNCWQDPAGCVFVKDNQSLVESVSTRFNSTNCQMIPFSFAEIGLNLGERMIFCDSLHAERVGISQAGKKNISLEGSTMYVNKFPCRSCAMEAIAAGIKTVIFERNSYGLAEVGDLFEVNKVIVKKIRS